MKDQETMLLLAQTVCCSVTLMLALMLLISRLYVQNLSRSYETSRWMLFSAMLLYAVHFLLQMLFGFRAQGEDVGALINILFYSPIAYIISYSSVRLASGKKHIKQYVAVGVSSIVLTLLIFIAGWFYYHSLHMPVVVYLMASVFFLTIMFFIFYPNSEVQRMRNMIESETASDIGNYNKYMQNGAVIVYIITILVPLAVFSTKAILFLSPFFLLALVFYVISFVSLGFNMSPVSEIIDDTIPDTHLPEEDTLSSTPPDLPQVEEHPRLTDEQAEMIEAAIEKWRQSRGFNSPNMNCAMMALRIGVPKKLLVQYLSERKGETFRVWLSNLRIEEVKRMLLSNSEFSNEAIASECGFSSRSWMQEKFKASTGMTPTEWKLAQIKKS